MSAARRTEEYGLTEYGQVVDPSTSRSTPAPRAATLLLRPASVCSTAARTWRAMINIDQSTGARRPREGRPPVPAACDTLRPSTASSATDSEPAHPQVPRALPSRPRKHIDKQGVNEVE